MTKVQESSSRPDIITIKWEKKRQEKRIHRHHKYRRNIKQKRKEVHKPEDTEKNNNKKIGGWRRHECEWSGWRQGWEDQAGYFWRKPVSVNSRNLSANKQGWTTPHYRGNASLLSNNKKMLFKPALPFSTQQQLKQGKCWIAFQLSAS